MASTQEDMAIAGAAVRQAIQGQSITYQRLDDKGRVSNETVIADAIVMPVGDEGYQDTEARFVTRAIDVEFAASQLSGKPVEHEYVVWDSETWSVNRVRTALGSHSLLCIRLERQEVTGDTARRDRRIATVGTVR